MDFIHSYGSEAQCHDALYRWRWPEGFCCPQCSYDGYCKLSRGLYQCHRCHRQTSVTSGTIFQGTKLPLNSWFLTMHLMTSAKNGISSMELSRQLGISYNAA